MDDNFLYQNRPPVRDGFRENLYTRLTKDVQPRKTPHSTGKMALQAGLACAFLLAAFFAFSKPARASVLDWIKHVAGFIVQENDSLPIYGDEVIIFPEAHNSLATVLENAPFEFAMPTYVPDGFHLEDNVDVFSDSVFLRWMNSIGDEILIQVETDHGQQYMTGTGAAQEIQVNDQPAMLVEGGYDTNNNWDPDRKMINIVQRRGQIIYWLIYIKTSEGELDHALITEELSRMMGSIP